MTPLPSLASSWHLHLLASNKAPQTIRTYLRSLRALEAFLQGAEPAKPRLEAFMLDRLQQSKPASAAVHFRSLQQFFKWAVEEGEIESSPMAKLKAPVVPEESPAILADADIRRLLKSCEGRGFADRRDNALVRLLLDTGMPLPALGPVLIVADVAPLGRLRLGATRTMVDTRPPNPSPSQAHSRHVVGQRVVRPFVW